MMALFAIYNIFCKGNLWLPIGRGRYVFDNYTTAACTVDAYDAVLIMLGNKCYVLNAVSIFKK